MSGRPSDFWRTTRRANGFSGRAALLHETTERGSVVSVPSPALPEDVSREVLSGLGATAVRSFLAHGRTQRRGLSRHHPFGQTSDNSSPSPGDVRSVDRASPNWRRRWTPPAGGERSGAARQRDEWDRILWLDGVFTWRITAGKKSWGSRARNSFGGHIRASPFPEGARER